MPVNLALCFQVAKEKEEQLMTELIDAILKWPIIVQGALGSGLFWLLLFLGQKTVEKISKIYSHKSNEARISRLTTAQFKYALGTGIDDHETNAHYFAVLIYRSLRYLFRALMWVILGLVVNSFISPLGIIGYLGALFYLFKAYEVVAPNTESEEVNATKLDEVIAELDELKSI